MSVIYYRICREEANQDYHLHFGLYIKQYREEHQLTVFAFAKLCEIKVDVLERIEGGSEFQVEDTG